jgi:hypothetical protein
MKDVLGNDQVESTLRAAMAAAMNLGESESARNLRYSEQER